MTKDEPGCPATASSLSDLPSGRPDCSRGGELPAPGSMQREAQQHGKGILLQGEDPGSQSECVATDSGHLCGLWCPSVRRRGHGAPLCVCPLGQVLAPGPQHSPHLRGHAGDIGAPESQHHRPPLPRTPAESPRQLPTCPPTAQPWPRLAAAATWAPHSPQDSPPLAKSPPNRSRRNGQNQDSRPHSHRGRPLCRAGPLEPRPAWLQIPVLGSFLLLLLILS